MDAGSQSSVHKGEATLIEVIEVDNGNKILLGSSKSSEEVDGDNEESIGDEEAKIQEKNVDRRHLLLILCLLTFEAEYPEEFYDAICKSNFMKSIVKSFKTRKMSSTSFQDMC